MKKTVLLFAIAISAYGAHAQVTLSGTSYMQDFNLLGAGMPTGWSTYHNATSTSLGTLEALTSTLDGYPSMKRPDTSCAGLVVGGGFKNFPSATVATAGDNWCAAPPTYSNRALGVRQVSPTNGTHPNLDPGAAFAVQLANTTGLTAFHLTFKLQALDTSSPRITTWSVDYGFGASPTTFTPATTTGTVTTGGNAFSNNTVSVNFGSALDNHTGPVWIRIVTLTATSGSGNRASSAIDDFNLTWTGGSNVGVTDVSANGVMPFSALGIASSSTVNLQATTAEAGNYTLNIYDMTGRNISNENLQLNEGTQTITVSNKHLAAGMYIAKLNNGKSQGIAKVIVQ
jgi:hypothetical protein